MPKKAVQKPKPMKVLVVRQPWAWAIVNAGKDKDIENRSWPTKYRGPLLIQASANLPKKEWFEEDKAWIRKRGIELPETFETGGIVGMVQLDDCVTKSKSKWFQGPVGWVLSRQRRVKFTPLKGQLGLFDPPAAVVKKLKVLRGPKKVR